MNMHKNHTLTTRILNISINNFKGFKNVQKALEQVVTSQYFDPSDFFDDQQS